MSRAFDNFQVVDFTHVLAGPMATNYMCQQGADVIKVESAAGDLMRNYGVRKTKDGLGPSFVAINAGKRSIVLDLKRADHLDVARRLIAKADVVVENFRPGVMDRLGLGYQACRTLREDLVYCSISGFGQSGALRSHPAIDQIIQSMSGLMEVSGEPGSAPVRIGFPIVDTFSGLLAAFAITSALLRRERSGDGQCIDLAMFDAAMVMMVSLIGPLLNAGVKPEKQGNRGYSMSPTADTFPTGDGDLTLGVTRDDQFAALCAAIDREDLGRDPRYTSKSSRLEHMVTLRAAICETLSTRSAVEWEQRISHAGLAVGRVLRLEQAIALDHLTVRQLKAKIPLPLDHGSAEVLRSGFILAADPVYLERPPPLLGEHTSEILGKLGYSSNQIETLVTP